MRYRAIITDLDGTAIPHVLDAQPSRRVVESIRKARERGVHVSASTGRPLSIAKDVIRMLGLTDPCAISDSTALYDPVSEKIIKVFPISYRAAKSVADILISRNLPFFVGEKGNEYPFSGGALPRGLSGLAVPDLTLEEAEQLITLLSHIPDISLLKMHSYRKGLVWLAVTSSGATKLHGVIEITGMLGIDPAETIGIGDGYNDYPLLSACGLKIAMGNAVPELKAIADFIAPSVEEDGLATVIEKFFLS